MSPAHSKTSFELRMDYQSARSMAFATLIPPCILLRPRRASAGPGGKRVSIDLQAFREMPFALFNLATFVGNVGLYIPYFYITPFASAQAGLGNTMSFYMLPILAAGSVLDRIAPGFAADVVAPLNILSTCTLIAGLSGFCWVAITSSSTAVAALIIWSVLYGAFSGAFVSLQSSTVVSTTEDLSTIGGRLGLNTFGASLGLLVGRPIAGVLVQKEPSWPSLQVLCGAPLFLAGELVAATRCSRVGTSAGAIA